MGVPELRSPLSGIGSYQYYSLPQGITQGTWMQSSTVATISPEMFFSNDGAKILQHYQQQAYQQITANIPNTKKGFVDNLREEMDEWLKDALI